MEHVIVAGGVKGIDTIVPQDDIEVLNWIENSHWRRASIILPVTMDCFTPIIAEGYFCIVGHDGIDNKVYNSAYKIPIVNITRSDDQKQASDTPIKWITMTPAVHYSTTLVSSSSPPMVVGECSKRVVTTTTSDIKMLDESSKSWRNIVSLSSARSAVAIATVNENTIIIFGGCSIKKERMLYHPVLLQ